MKNNCIKRIVVLAFIGLFILSSCNSVIGLHDGIDLQTESDIKEITIWLKHKFIKDC